MEFKVGDRVEAIKPPINLEKSDPDEVGIGVIKEVNPRPFDGAYLVKLDSGPEWAYWESYLRPAPIATPTPSITVGTQVRLTGVVTKVTSNGIGVSFGEAAANDALIYSASILEVIRQPFKRGEVVYFEDHNIACVVLEDEQNGRMLLIEAGEGKYATYVDADQYERRP